MGYDGQSDFFKNEKTGNPCIPIEETKEMTKTYFMRLCLVGAVVLFLVETWESSTVQAAKTWTGVTSSE